MISKPYFVINHLFQTQRTLFVWKRRNIALIVGSYHSNKPCLLFISYFSV